MNWPPFLRRALAVVATAWLLAVSVFAVGGPAGAAAAHARIQGTGSSWAYNAVNQWVADVDSSGLQVDFTGSGSAQGRKDFANRITDFAVSDIGYQGHDPLTGAEDTNCFEGTNNCRDFAYEPIVAGGTAFPYQLRVNGQLVRNLRLSGETLAKIFTHKITNWSDPAITKDNNGRQFPALPIIPVVHSEGSGSTAQFTTYLDTMYPSIWRSFTGKAGFTEYFPPPSGGDGIAQNGSDGVMNFVSSAAANGAIGYDEYSYPLAKNWPVAKILNKAGYYTLPDQYNVAVALQHAHINMDKSSPNYLLQTLNDVYVAPEAQAYPLSSYSYFLIPTSSSDPRMTTAKRQTLTDFLYYAVCQGQKEMGPIGYSPLPINLVEASFAQTNKLKVADPGVDITARNVETCDNPTFYPGHPEINRLAKIAPLPAQCDHLGQGPCGTANTGTGGNPGGDGGNGTGNGTGHHGNKNSSSGAGGTGGDSGATGNDGNTGNAPGGTGSQLVRDPDTGALQAVGDGGTNSGGDIQRASTELSAYRQPGLTGVLAPLAVVELLVLLVLPPIVYYQVLVRRRPQKDQKDAA